MNTREDFDREWAVAVMPKDKQRLVDAAWQACAAHYEAELLKRDALIAEKDEALALIAEYQVFDTEMAETAQDALSLTHDSVRLVRVGVVNGCDKAPELSNGTATIFFGEYPPGTKLYTIVKGERYEDRIKY